jgi:hypothetical protein
VQRAPADEVYVQMKNRLPGSWTNIQYGAVTFFDRPLPGDVSGGKMTPSQQFRVFGSRFFQTRYVFFRDNQNVSRALRIQIFESKGVLVFVHFLGRHFAANDAAK